MYVREDDSGIILERVEHTIAVMRVDVDVRNAFEPRLLTQ